MGRISTYFSSFLICIFDKRHQYLTGMERDILSTNRKALRINLNQKIYGTIAEIGGGQEVARNFFLAGGASGTIAKAMSDGRSQIQESWLVASISS